MRNLLDGRQVYWYYFFNWTGPPRQAAWIGQGRGRESPRPLSFKRGVIPEKAGIQVSAAFWMPPAYYLPGQAYRVRQDETKQ
jgi:hypothetical protein